MAMPEIDLFTTAVLPLELFFNDLPLGHATGFLWRASATRQLYIVTNWHVVSAKDFFTLRNLHKRSHSAIDPRSGASVFINLSSWATAHLHRIL